MIERARPASSAGSTSARVSHAAPMMSAGAGLGGAFLQKEDVDDDFGSGGGFHAAFRQPDGANEIGHGGDMLARLLIGLVHGPAAGDEGGEAARFQPLDRAGDEIIMQGEASRPAGSSARTVRSLKGGLPMARA